MKRLVSAFLVAGLAVSLTAFSGGRKYGKELTLKVTTVLSELFANPEKFNGKRVLIEGRISEVCQKKGCWIKVADDSKTDAIQVKVEDDVIVFLKTVKGKKVRAEGIVSVMTLSKEEILKRARHEAEEQGKLKEFDPTSIKTPATVVRIEGEGVIIEE